MMRSSKPERLVYESILPVAWLIAIMVVMLAGFWAAVTGPSWTGGLIVALILALSFTLRYRFEVDRKTGHMLTAWVASLAPGLSLIHI